MAMKKVLMLHGYSQNATIFSKRMGAIRKTCGKDIDFVFVDAPHILQPVDIGTSLEALNSVEGSAHPTDPAETPRAWWKSNADRTVYSGVEESLQVLRDAMAKNNFEGVFGFSQGAAMAAFLVALLERPHMHPPFLVNGDAPHPPLKFCVAVSGFKINDRAWSRVLSPTYATPTLHVIGKNDVIVIPERSQSLIDASANKRIEAHDGGHFVPSKANWRSFFRDYLRDPFGDVSSPGMGSAGPSQPASGVATPIEGTLSIHRL